jgi:hypothetical protein
VARHQSGDGFGGVGVDQQDAQAVGLSREQRCLAVTAISPPAASTTKSYTE